MGSSVSLGLPGAKLVFAVTTPPCIGPERKVQFTVTNERAQAFNHSALKIMNKYGVAINDLYSAIEKNPLKIPAWQK